VWNLKRRAEEQGLVPYVIELLSSWASVDTRRMFGGTGLFMGGRMFAIFFDDVLYLKNFVEAKVSPELSDKEYLGYERNGKFVNLGYFKAPERCLEDSRYLIELAKQSYQSACAKKVKAKPKRKINEPPSMPAPF
jgi:DNA transformation protein